MEVSRPLRVLEFYSGIGGMRYALEQAEVGATVVEAFEINDMANDVYEHNFNHRPSQGNIQHLTVRKLDSYEADAWLLSPPCQPYTRQGMQKDAEDSRAASFLKLLEMLPFLTRPPSYLFVENVVGFESSVSCGILTKTLKKSDFSIQEFILTPLQFGIPYSRPRYFCLAKRRPFYFLHPELDDQLTYNPVPSACSFIQNHDPVCKVIQVYLEEDEQCAGKGGLDNAHVKKTRVKDGIEGEVGHESFMVPNSLIDRWGDAFDVVTPYSNKCCCFTKSYGRFVKETEHVLEQLDVGKTPPDATKSKESLKELRLRYFTPREIANLHSFPKAFDFPDHITTKQRYALLGNSLSVAVVASLLRYLFHNRR
ncbi:hypothetical protein KP509_09G097100 [Ceratopteris richardii]|uniref:DNA methyltransferase 2 n=1 Tax=Ceratopteris richardii TaxID=49495 RepID=A0A8T2U773_CERRI|nr:hypothetical protein KP509_09G097100 [Ceratopteris richardii]